MSDLKKTPSVIDSKYFVVEQLGHGVQGQVFKVQSLSEPDKLYALKLIDIKEKNSQIVRKIENYIKSEFSLLKSLNHQNIVKVFDFSFDPILKSYYFTMEYLAGQSLYSFFQLDNAYNLFPEIAKQILYGLHFLHANKIIHYDINPSNIIILNQNDGFKIKLLDFGLAEINQMNRHARVKKNILYISPELYTKSGEITERIDIYSLGVSLLHSLSKEVKLNLSRLSDIDFHTTDKKIFDHKFLLDSLPSEKIRRFVAGMIERNPKLRPANAEEALHSLNQIFNTSFPLPKVATQDSFQKNSRFLIRNDIVNLTINYFCNYRAPNKKSAIVISGESGSGKSRVAEQLHFNFSCMFNKTLLFNSDSSRKLFGVIISLINEVYLISSPYLKTDMRSFYTLLNQINRNIRKSSYYQTLFQQIFNLLLECCAIRHLTVIFDDFEKYDLYSQQFINYLVMNSKHLQMNIIILFSTTGLNKKEEEVLSWFRESGKAEFLKLNPLSMQDIKYIRQFLMGKSSSFPEDFEDKLHKAGGSNFRRLMLIFDNLISNRAIKKQDGVYQLDNRPKLLKVLKMNAVKLSQTVIQNLSKEEAETLALLAFSGQPLSETKISQLLNISLPTVHQIIIHLDKLRLIVGIKKDQFTTEYRLYSTEIAFSMLPSVNKELLLNILNLLAKDGYFEKNTEQLFYFIVKNKSFPAETLSDLLDKIDEPERLLFYTHLIEKIKPDECADDPEIKSILLLRQISCSFLYNNNSMIKSLWLKLNKNFNSVQNPKIIVKVISKEIELFNRDAKFDKSAALMLKHSSIIMSETGGKSFYDSYFKLLKNTINSGFYKISKKISLDIDRLLTLDKDHDYQKIYLTILKAVQILARQIVYRAEFKSEMEHFIDEIQKSDQNKDLLCELYNNYYSICRTFKQETHKDWQIWLTDALVFTDELGLKFYYTKISNLLCIHYYALYDYRNALSVIKKQIVVAKEINQDELSFYYINKAIMETDLLHPANEIIATKKEGLELARFNNYFSSFVQCSSSLCNTYIYTGDFITASIYWQESYDFFRFCPLKDVRLFLENFIYKGIFLFGSAQLKIKITSLFNRRLLSKDDYNYSSELIDKAEDQLTDKKSYTDEKGVIIAPVVYSTNLPGLLLLMINKNKKIPSRHEFSTMLDGGLAHKPFFRIAKNIVKYMLSPEDGQLEKNYLTLKKIYHLGYELDVFYNLAPLLEYLFMIKNSSRQTIQLIELLKEITNSMFSRMNDVQKDFFMQIYEYKRVEKTLARFEILLKKK